MMNWCMRYLYCSISCPRRGLCKLRSAKKKKKRNKIFWWWKLYCRTRAYELTTGSSSLPLTLCLSFIFLQCLLSRNLHLLLCCVLPLEFWFLFTGLVPCLPTIIPRRHAKFAICRRAIHWRQSKIKCKATNLQKETTIWARKMSRALYIRIHQY